MNETEKNDVAEFLADLLGEINDQIPMYTALQNMTFDQLTPDLWVALQAAMSNTVAILEYNRKSIAAGAQFIDNDALISHVTASFEA